jgi:hypothetical protein
MAITAHWMVLGMVLGMALSMVRMRAMILRRIRQQRSRGKRSACCA